MKVKAIASLVFMLASPAFGEPSYYEAFDFKSCLHWKIDNEVHGTDLSQESKRYIAALELEKRQPYSWHKIIAEGVGKLSDADGHKLAVIYSAYAYDTQTEKEIERYGVCSHYPADMTCLPNQDFPLAGASYKVARSKGPLYTLVCATGCTGAPAMIHYMGYENMDGERNIEREAALRKFRKMCGRALTSRSTGLSSAAR